MACSITITDVRGFFRHGTQTLGIIRVTGTANDCQSIRVNVRCGEGGAGTGPVTPDGSGNWTADIGTAFYYCNCGDNVQVTAECDYPSPPSCRATWSGRLNCQPPPCPTVTNLSYSLPEGGCAGRGRSVTVTFTGVVSDPPPSGCVFEWSFGDGTSEVTTVPTTSHTYGEARTYPVNVIARWADCQMGTPLSVSIPPCCPVVNGVNQQVDGCADGEGRSATVTLTATTDPPSASTGSFTWTFDDGTPPVTILGPTKTYTRTYASPGTKTITVQYQPSGEFCEPTTVTVYVDVPSCLGLPPVTTPTPRVHLPGGNGSDGCLALRWAIVIAGAMALVAAFVAVCFTVPQVVAAAWGIAAVLALAAIAATLAMILMHCPSPCGLFWWVTWHVLLAAGVGILAFSPCCPEAAIAGALGIFASIPPLGVWVGQCRPDPCDVVRDVTVTLVSVVFPVLGAIQEVPALGSCISTSVTAAYSIISGALAAASIFCHRTEFHDLRPLDTSHRSTS